jgi:sulfide:quinone oxidoreductase
VDKRIVILGAGFGGLELSARLSEEFGDEANVTLIDMADGFTFGFSKFDLMFGRKNIEDVRLYYRDLVKPGVEFRRETITAIDPAARRVTTDHGTHEADILVIALGAQYDFSTPPGFADDCHEFYSVEGALKLRDELPSFQSGSIVIGVLGLPFKCPPAPCEAALLLDEWLEERGLTDKASVTVVSPWPRPVPPSPSASEAILKRFAERGITWMPDQAITSLDPARKVAVLRGGEELGYDLFLGVPVHRVPDVVLESGLAVDGWIPVNPVNLATQYPDVYAVGDVSGAPVAKAGVFSESAAQAVADHLIAELRGGRPAAPYTGTGTCYIEFGGGKVGRVDADFLSGPSVTAPFFGPSLEGAEQKEQFGETRRKRWFGS